ncbi:hypothetical protein C8K15_106168 [Paenisporosarcina sp. OV554]|nr:hypothetical protein C8K15_106168 [Paenisporosarcina sp. OV554]
MKKLLIGFISIMLLVVVVVAGCSETAKGEKNNKPKKSR